MISAPIVRPRFVGRFRARDLAMPPEISAIIAALGGHANGSGWIARCPAHDDGTPSLSVSVANGKTLVHCQAGCSQQDVIAELRKQGLWQKKQDTLGPIVATYEYRRPNGELAYQVCKYLEPEKTFRQRQPDGAGWTWRTKGMDPIPYRLPELLAANSSSPVFIAEGEKDCDNIAKLGLTATCNHMGAKNWKRKISHWLRGYDVVLLPDNDRTGREHVEDVAEKLKGIAKRIRVLALPGLAEKGDVSDWIAQAAPPSNSCRWPRRRPIGRILHQRARRMARTTAMVCLSMRSRSMVPPRICGRPSSPTTPLP